MRWSRLFPIQWNAQVVSRSVPCFFFTFLFIRSTKLAYSAALASKSRKRHIIIVTFYVGRKHTKYCSLVIVLFFVVSIFLHHTFPSLIYTVSFFFFLCVHNSIHCDSGACQKEENESIEAAHVAVASCGVLKRNAGSGACLRCRWEALLRPLLLYAAPLSPPCYEKADAWCHNLYLAISIHGYIYIYI